jgi:uncharacterized delta-60 repeat protein
MKRFIYTVSVFLVQTVCFAQFPTFDISWNSNGRVTTTDSVSFNSHIITSTGKVLACGNIIKNNKPYLFVTKYNANGTLDNTFGTNGKLVIDFGFSSQGATSIVVDNNNRIIVGGNIQSSGGHPTSQPVVCALNMNGVLDNTFGINGKVVLNPTSNGDFLRGMDIDSQNNIYIGGVSTTNYFSASSTSLVMKLTSNGTLSTGFGTNGVVLPTFSGSSGNRADGGLVVDGNKVVCAGTIGLNRTDYVLMFRLNTSNGSFDNTFNGNGIKTVGITDVIALSLVKANDKNYYISGANYSGSWYLTVMGFNSSNGSLLTSFNSTGYKTYVIGTGRSITQGNDGFLYVGGDVSGVGYQITKVNLNGSLDNTFGTNGVFSYKPGTSNAERIYGIKTDACNNVLIAGWMNSGTKGTIYRLKTNSSGCNCYTTVYDTIKTYLSVVDTLKISSIITGMNNLPSNFGTVKIFPNPTHSILNIEVSNPSPNYTIKITNSTSQTLFTTQLTTSNYQLNLSTLGAKGLYFIQILDNTNKLLETKKLVLE